MSRRDDLYNYGPPVTEGTAADQVGVPQDNSSATTEAGTSGAALAPPPPQDTEAGTSGSPSYESGAGSTAVLGSLNPNTAVHGDPDFTMHAIGTGFQAGDDILMDGVVMATTFVSATDLTTVVDCSARANAGVVVVRVQSGARITDPVNFTYT